MQHLLITGGIARENGFELGDGKYYGEAVLVKLNLETGETEKLLSITEGNENYPAEHPNLQFTAGQIHDGQLWLPTDTEVHVYEYPSLRQLKNISHPYFQNVHSVHIIDQQLVVTSTGLDMVAILDLESGETLKQINVEGKEPWFRFDPQTDYRQVHSTRPHQGHPNYVYQWQGELWVTRCTQEDCVNLNDVEKRINVSGDDKAISIHDGHLQDGKVYFTSVDGWLIVACPDSLEVIESINLNTIGGNQFARGWCRGIWLDGDKVHVAYSQLRKTRTRSRLSWLKSFVQSEQENRPASVVTYDLKSRELVREYLLPEDHVQAIYSVLPEPKVKAE